MKLLKDLYKIHAPSEGEKKIKRYIKRWVRWTVPTATIYADSRNIYITKGKAETYPCVVAHLDQVQNKHSADFEAVETKDIIFGYSPSNRRQEGLGADDKNGIWIALKCLQKYDNIKVAFFYGEEIGCLGSSRADMSFFDDVRFVIEPDRRGYKDLITSIGYGALCSDEFVDMIEPQNYGYSETNGMMTDVETLRDNGLEVSCINLSCGYYEPHTDREFTVKADLLNCLSFVQHIIETVTEVSVFKDTYEHYKWRDYGYCDDGWDWWDKYCSPSKPTKGTATKASDETDKSDNSKFAQDKLVASYDIKSVLTWQNFKDFDDFLKEYGEEFGQTHSKAELKEFYDKFHKKDVQVLS